MKKLFLFAFAAATVCISHAQGLKGFMKKVSGDSTGKSTLNSMLGSSGGGLSSSTIADGLKEALEVGTKKGAEKLSAANGFFKDAAIKNTNA